MQRGQPDICMNVSIGVGIWRSIFLFLKNTYISEGAVRRKTSKNIQVCWRWRLHLNLNSKIKRLTVKVKCFIWIGPRS